MSVIDLVRVGGRSASARTTGARRGGWRRFRLRALLAAAGAFVLLVLLGSALLTARALDLGRRDIALIEHVRSLETVTAQITGDAAQYLRIAPRDYPDYYRDTQVYYQSLRRQLQRVETLREELRALDRSQGHGALTALLAGDSSEFRRALADFDAFWTEYRVGLDERLGPDPEEPRLEWGAKHLDYFGSLLQRHVDGVSSAARAYVDHHFQTGQWLSQYGTMLGFLLAVVMITALLRFLDRRIRVTLDGCQDIALGRFGQRIPVEREDELSTLDEAVNDMSKRIAGVLTLIDGVQQGGDLDSTLGQLWSALSQLDRVDWLALYEIDQVRDCVDLRGQYPKRYAQPGVEAGSLPWQTGRARTLPVEIDGDVGEQVIGGALHRHRFASAMWVVMPMEGDHSFALLLASRQPDALAADFAELLGNVAPIIGHGLDKTLLAERLLLATVNGLSKLAESRDTETGNHLLRMSQYSRILAESYVNAGPRGEPDWNHDQSGEFIRDVLRFSPMHDIGKVGIPDSILLKPGRLSQVERTEMNMHPLIGGEVLRACAKQLPGRGMSLFKVAIDIAEGHHEKFDGSGYPVGLAGKDIPLAARIVAMADVFDALTSKRPYKEAWSPEQALEYLRLQSGKHFDPDLVAAFEDGLPAILDIYREHRHI